VRTKFPFILDGIGNEQCGRRFAIVIDKAHPSQGGRTAAAMSQALSEAGAESREETFEGRINRAMESRKLLPNDSYFAFTATPKNRTLETAHCAFPERISVLPLIFHLIDPNLLSGRRYRRVERENYFGQGP